MEHGSPPIPGGRPANDSNRTRSHKPGTIGPRRVTLAALAMLTAQAGLLGWGACRQSPTSLEVVQLPAGIRSWETGLFDLYRVNPPLVRLVASLPILAAGYEANWANLHDDPGARPEYAVGRDFMTVNGRRAFGLMTFARWACIPFSILGGWLCFAWSRALFDDRAALATLTLWCVSPDILAHGQLITPDLAAATAGVAAAYSFWRWLEHPGWRHTVIAGLALGFAASTKLTWLCLFGLWPAIWLTTARRGSTPFRHLPAGALRLTVIMGLAVYAIDLGYGFTGLFEPLGKLRFVSETLAGPVGPADEAWGNRFTETLWADLRLPLPADLLLGIDQQKRDFEVLSFPPSYLGGELRDGGWWYYYLYGLAVKTPLGTIALAALTPFALLSVPACRRLVAGRATAFRLLPLVLPPLVLLVLVSSQTRFSLHYRYVVPAVPFTFVALGGVAGRLIRRPGWTRVAGAVALAGSVASSLACYPHNLSYFNEPAGGPAGGSAHLIGSSIDWGQDLPALQDWTQAHPEARPLHVAFYGGYQPADIGLDWPQPLRPTAGGRGFPFRPGWYALSVTLIRGQPHRGWSEGEFTPFLSVMPVARAGYSIAIYHITEPGAGPP